ncbi:MAG: hypothetical protein R3C15_15670 [Thermoleophilia bacterium]
MIGRVYLERGEPVIVAIRWGPGGGPRNVLIHRMDGSFVVRPFRGLRRADLPARADSRTTGPPGRHGGLEPVGTLPGGAG